MRTTFRLFTLPLLALLFLANQTLAEHHPGHPRKKMELSVNPLQLLLGSLPLTFRVALSEKVALSLSAQGRFLSLGGDTNFYGGGGGVGVKFYLSGAAIEDSWYIEPALYFSYVGTGGKGFWALSPSVIGGYTWVWASGFLINLGLGAQYAINMGDTLYKGKKPFGTHGILPTGEFSLGWAW